METLVQIAEGQWGRETFVHTVLGTLVQTVVGTFLHTLLLLVGSFVHTGSINSHVYTQYRDQRETVALIVPV
jgi:hypothetical protein